MDIDTYHDEETGRMQAEADAAERERSEAEAEARGAKAEQERLLKIVKESYYNCALRELLRRMGEKEE